MALLVQEPDAAVGADARLPDVPGVGRDRRELTGRDVVAVEVGAAFAQVLEEQRRPVGPPVGRRDLAFEVELQAARTRPSRGSRSRVACRRRARGRTQGAGRRDGRPAARDQRHALVELLAHGLARARVEDAERGVDEVAVLGVLEAEQRAVRRERAPQEAVPVGASEAYRGVRAVDDLRLAAVERDVHGKAVAIGDRRRRRSPAPARVPRSTRAARPRGTATSRRRGTAARASGRTRRRSRPGTTARPRRRASERRRRARPDGSSPGAADPVSVSKACTCQIAGLVRDVDGVPRRGRRPLRQERHRRPEPLLPGAARSRARGYQPPRIAAVLVAGNWKMFKGAHQAREFAAQIRRMPDHAHGVDVVVCPPFVSLEATLQGLGDRQRRSRLRAERPLGARGRVHGRGLGADAARARRDGRDRRATPSGGSTSARPTRPCGSARRRHSRRGCT